MDALRAHRATAIIVFFCIMLILSPCISVAADISATESVLTSSIQLSSGKSIVLKSNTPIKRVSVAKPEVADFILLSPREIYITGKSAGSTNITLWQDNRVVAVYDLHVGYDVSRFKQHLNQRFSRRFKRHIHIRFCGRGPHLNLSSKSAPFSHERD